MLLRRRFNALARVRLAFVSFGSLSLGCVYLMRRGDNSAKNILLCLLFLKTAPDLNGEVAYNLTLPSKTSKISFVIHLPLVIYIYVPGDIG